MSDQDSTSNPSTPSRRRASFSPGQALSDIFGRNPGTATYPRPIATAAAQAGTQRRISISTLGLSGASPTSTSPWAAASAMGRRGSMSSAGTGTSSSTIDENAVEEGDATSIPSSPFARRMSFGAQALRNARSGNASSASVSRAPGSGSPTSKTREGFNWSDSLRSRAESTVERSASQASQIQAAAQQQAATAGAATGPSAAQQKATRPPPDHFQERILKGEFYMD